MKVTMIGSRGIPASYGGVEKHVEELSTRLVEKGYKVTVICRAHYTPPMEEYKGVRIVRLPTVEQKHTEMAFHTFSSIWYTLLYDRPDILHIQSVDPALFSFLARAGTSVVATSHGQAYRRDKWGSIARWMSKLAERGFMYCTDRRISVSRTLKDYYEQKYRREVTYIPNGVNILEIEGVERLAPFGLRGDDYILYVGRLIPTKGPGLLIKAYKNLDTEKKLVIAGGTSYTSGYERKLRENASGKIIFTGYQYGEILWQLFRNCSLFVFPSEIEGLPIVLLEAMSFAAPIVFSDIPENLEAAEGVGLAFRNKDQKDLEDKIGYALAHQNLMKDLGQAARKRVEEQFNWEAVVERTEAVYQSLLP